MADDPIQLSPSEARVFGGSMIAVLLAVFVGIVALLLAMLGGESAWTLVPPFSPKFDEYMVPSRWLAGAALVFDGVAGLAGRKGFADWTPGSWSLPVGVLVLAPAATNWFLHRGERRPPPVEPTNRLAPVKPSRWR